MRSLELLTLLAQGGNLELITLLAQGGNLELITLLAQGGYPEVSARGKLFFKILFLYCFWSYAPIFSNQLKTCMG